MVFRNIKLLSDYTILAKDGEIGKIDDFLFDDITWTIRYLVIDTGQWLPGRKVLLSPEAVGRSLWELQQQFAVNLTREQIKNSPNIHVNRPVSLQQQIQLHDYYVWPYYWKDAGFAPVYPSANPEIKKSQETVQEELEKGDPHLKSMEEVIDCHIQVTDGEIGRVEDFLIDDEGWVIHYMVVDTNNWLPDRNVLISPTWITRVNWAEQKVSVFLSQESVKNSPKYFPNEPVSQEYENRLHDYYGLSK